MGFLNDSNCCIDYHSFFFNLLSWKNPRATAITFVGVLVFIFACRYLPILRLALKGTWTILGGKSFVATQDDPAKIFSCNSS